MTIALAPEPRSASLRPRRAPRPRRVLALVPTSHSAAARLRVHPVALAATALVLAATAAPSAGVRALAGDALPAGAHLALPATYVALSPLARMLDALCLLSTAQHVAVLATVLALLAAWRLRRARRRLRLGGRAFVAWREARAAAGVLGVVLALYAAATLAPRPMAALTVDDPDVLRVDFHSHTRASHDVPGWFGAAERRAWSAAAGYDAAYVSDHRTFDGATAAMAANPRRAGDGTVLLPALEARLENVHVVVLGVDARDAALLPDDHVERTLPAALRDGTLRGRAVATIATIPDPVTDVLRADLRDGATALRAVEVVDGAPRGIAQGDDDAGAIAARAARLGLLPVAASNHHGWGRTALAWNLVRLPGWRAMSPPELDARLVALVRAGAPGSVSVVTRTRPALPTAGRSRALALAATVPTLVWQAATALEPTERAVWLAWIWGAALLAHAVATSAERRTAHRQGRPVARAGGRVAMVGE